MAESSLGPCGQDGQDGRVVRMQQDVGVLLVKGLKPGGQRILLLFVFILLGDQELIPSPSPGLSFLTRKRDRTPVLPTSQGCS